MRHFRRRRLGMVGVVAAASLLAAACSSSSSPGTSSSGGGTTGVVTISNEAGSLWTCGFNPYNGATAFLSVGFTYEPLVYINPLQNGKAVPMLATAWQWGAGNKSLTFTIRKGVKFNDGVPMTAADVVYTFDLLKRVPALDLSGVWSYLSGVTQTGTDQVTMTFKSASVPEFYYVADQTPILPEHIWSKISNPATFADPSPVGTGPYKVSPCTKTNITYVANKDYWQSGEPHISKIQYPAFTSNNTANDELSTGQAQWGGQYIPGIQAFYLAKSNAFHYWFPPTVNVTLIPNLTNPLLANVKVRQAISYAIDRTRVSQIGESGYEPPSNQAGIVTPTFSSWLDTSAESSYGNYAYNPTKAKQLLTSAGYHMGSGGIMTNSAGKQLNFTVQNVGGNSDWVASMQVITQELKAVGIQLTPENLTSTLFDANLYKGSFQFIYNDQQTFGPAPYYELNDWLNSAYTAPIGQTAATNWERYKSTATDNLLNSYQTTTSTATQHSIIDQLQQVMLSQVPVIPVVEAVDWFQYDTSGLSGWPTQGDPYAQPAPYAYPDMEQVLLHLKSS